MVLGPRRSKPILEQVEMRIHALLNVCRKWAGRYPSLGPGVISTKDLPCSYRQMGCIIERLPRS